MSLFTDIGILFAAYAFSVALCMVARKALLRGAFLDHPNDRSSHSSPVPRGGGLVLVLILVPGMIGAALAQHTFAPYSGLIVGTVLLAMISWHDDRRGSSASLRLGMHIMAACIGSLALLPDAVLFGGHIPFWLDRTLMIIGWAWFMNLYNFMDGIDGITGMETLFIVTGVCLISSMTGTQEAFGGILTLLMTGAVLGFLVLNWHPAKIFLGDVGSVPLGYLTGYVLLTIACKGLWAPALILPLYYIADSGVTLGLRIARGEKFWKPHRQHFYQRAAHKVRRHDRVVWWIATTNVMLMILAATAVFYPWRSLIAAILIVALLLKKMHKGT